MSEILQKMISAGDNGLLNPGAIARYQVEATLELAEQAKRIADILDGAMEVDPENPDAGRYVWVRVREE